SLVNSRTAFSFASAGCHLPMIRSRGPEPATASVFPAGGLSARLEEPSKMSIASTGSARRAHMVGSSDGSRTNTWRIIAGLKSRLSARRVRVGRLALATLAEGELTAQAAALAAQLTQRPRTN